MTLVFGFIMLLFIYVVFKLFVEGFLFKLILFVGGWFGIYIALLKYVDGADKVAVVIAGTAFSWAVVVPTVICFLCLLCSRTYE